MLPGVLSCTVREVGALSFAKSFRKVGGTSGDQRP